MRWLRINVSGDCADDRMISVLDLLMTRKCQTHCTWTGASRKGAKSPIMIHQHMLKVFEEIGNSEVEIVTKANWPNFSWRGWKMLASDWRLPDCVGVHIMLSENENSPETLLTARAMNKSWKTQTIKLPPNHQMIIWTRMRFNAQSTRRGLW